MKNLIDMTVAELNDYAEELKKETAKIKLEQQRLVELYAGMLTHYIVNNLDAIKQNPTILLRYGFYRLMDDEEPRDAYKFDSIEKSTHPEVPNCFRIFDEKKKCIAIITKHLNCADWMGAGIGLIPYTELCENYKENGGN